MKGRILVVDDHREIIYAVRRLLESRGHEVLSTATPREAMELAQRADALIVDIQLDGECGLALLASLRAAGMELPAVVLSAHTFPDNVVEASKHGALQILANPLDAEALVHAVEEALTHATLTDPPPLELNHQAILGGSAPMMEVFKRLGVAAANDLSVLLTGETGVGKEVAAELIHRHSRRADGPFVAINCTALPESLLESELFGHVAGAFTGASRAALGKVESAAGGTLFLDEIGDMPLAFQAKLLRFLEDRSFYRVGDAAPHHADVRVLAATNRELLNAPDSRFRSDLYFRLAQIPIEIPPLRERPEDLPGLIDVFIRTANAEMALDIQGVSLRAREQALAHPWPGNVRELKNAVYRAAAQRQRGVIETFELGAPNAATAEGDSAVLDRLIDAALHAETLPELLRSLEQRALERALEHFHGNKSRVAAALGVSRNTLRARLLARSGEPT